METLSSDLRAVGNLLSARAAPEQGGVLSGIDPTVFNTSNPLRLWIIQVFIIVTTSLLLSILLKKINQPKVIAEVIGGIILGPTAMGRIPHFTQHIFPAASLPFLSLTANIGLVLFLFIVGIEIDGSSIRRNTRTSIIIALGGLLLPFAVGAGMAKVIYDNFIPSSTIYTNFMLFMSVSYSITAFPVLCRILTELKLLDSKVGVCVLSAGVCNDIIGWTLLALCVALVNASSGLTSLWIILTALGWALFLLYPVRIGLLWFARRSGSTKNGPTMIFMAITMILVFTSAFFTDVIGVHAIFGGFLVGLVVPREGGLTVAIAEKLEDLITIVFLPLYFTLSGLSTDLGTLNTGKAWGYVFAIMATDWSGKFTGASIAARIAGLRPREAATVGTFMSCKGLVELVVLNIGRQAGILPVDVFSMFVLDALVLTFLTTPIAVAFYPPHLRTKAIDSDANKLDTETAESTTQVRQPSPDVSVIKYKSRFIAVLDKSEHLPGLMGLSQLLSPQHSSYRRDASMRAPPTLDALRLVALTDRTSAVIRTLGETHSDDLLRIFKTFGELNGFLVKADLSIVPATSFGQTIGERSYGTENELVLVGLALGSTETTQSSTDETNAGTASSFRQSEYTRDIFLHATTDVALYIDRRAPMDPIVPLHGRKRIFLAFFGGPDDRSALKLVVQMCASERATAVVLRLTQGEGGDEGVVQETKAVSQAGEKKGREPSEGLQLNTVSGYPDTMYPQANTVAQLQSRVADDMLWDACTSPSDDSPHLDALRNITFESKDISRPLHAILQRAAGEYQVADASQGRLLTVLGRSRRQTADALEAEFKGILEEHHGSSGSGGEMRRTIGLAATAVVVSGLKTDLLVVQGIKTVA